MEAKKSNVRLVKCPRVDCDLNMQRVTHNNGTEDQFFTEKCKCGHESCTCGDCSICIWADSF